jgi:DNA-binding NtrC family response regulator
LGTGVDLEGKRILIVDDEADIIETLKELLEMCVIDTAPDFEAARALLVRWPYDAAILDIMGVRGYDLLKITVKRDIPTLMLTAHALSPQDFVKSIRKGALAYVPKEKISEIKNVLADILESKEKGLKGFGRWFERLEPFFERRFGPYWKEKIRETEDPDFWKKYI